jgi:hypothetical protein
MGVRERLGEIGDDAPHSAAGGGPSATRRWRSVPPSMSGITK